MPGSRMIFHRGIPALSAAATCSANSDAMSAMRSLYVVFSEDCMVVGSPRMCIRTNGRFRAATVGSICGSIVPPDTSLMTSAPAKAADLATSASKVSTEMITSGDRDLTAWMTGMTRVSSSLVNKRVAPGLVAKSLCISCGSRSGGLPSYVDNVCSFCHHSLCFSCCCLHIYTYTPVAVVLAAASTAAAAAATAAAAAACAVAATATAIPISGESPPITEAIRNSSKSATGASTKSLSAKRGCGTSRSNGVLVAAAEAGGGAAAEAGGGAAAEAEAAGGGAAAEAEAAGGASGVGATTGAAAAPPPAAPAAAAAAAAAAQGVVSSGRMVLDP
ncbi:unnamed protein product [Closterium sp. NIES-53]